MRQLRPGDAQNAVAAKLADRFEVTLAKSLASLLLAVCAACVFGLSIPAALHALKLDPKIAAGPVALAFTDIFTLLFYFGLAAWLL